MAEIIRKMKVLAKSIPLLGPAIVHFRSKPDSFVGSAKYWDKRYRTGGHSGAGSYNRLAAFKANFLNTFVTQNQITCVVEHGCGDGAQLKLARYPQYTGLDISPKAVEICRSMFAADPTKHFYHLDEERPILTADLALSLDVIYHLVEDNVFEKYMCQLFDSARRFVIVYSSNIEQDWRAKHVRHRHFTRWVEQNRAEWRLQYIVKNDYPYDDAQPEQTSFADFFVFAPQSP